MVQLKRSLGLLEVTLMSVGVILGAGVYVLIGKAAGLSGNALWLSFILAAIVASLTGLSYAELSSRFPHAAAEYIYVKNSFGPHLAWLVGWFIIVGSVIGATTVAMGFANYFSVLFQTPVIITAFILLAICGAILILGVKESALMTIIFTLIEAAGLVIIIVIGIPDYGSVDYSELAKGFSGIIQAGVLIFFGYIGFESITRLAEETKNPKKTIPRAIIYSIIITTVFYILVGISAVSVVPWQELTTAKAPLSLIAERVFGSQSFLILSVIALFSTFNTTLVMLLSGSRIVYGMAREKALPDRFTAILKIRQTPWIAIIALMFAAMFFLIIGDIAIIANLTNFTIFIVFLAVNAAVIYLRYKSPQTQNGFRIPFAIGKMPVIPFLGFCSVAFMLISLPLEVLGLGAILGLLGILFYYLLYLHKKGKGKKVNFSK